MAQIFTKSTLNAGKKLYLKKQVYDLKKIDNIIHAKVKDKKYYDVTYTLNDQNKIIKMKCSCLSQRNCLHEAAVYYGIVQAKLLQQPKEVLPAKEESKVEIKTKVIEDPIIEYKSSRIDDLYHEIRFHVKRDKDIHSTFMSELTKRANNTTHIRDIIDYIDQYNLITNYPKSYRNKVILFFQGTLKILAYDYPDSNRDILLDWLIDNQVNNKYKEYFPIFNDVINHFSTDQVLDSLSKIINRYPHFNQELDPIIKLYFKLILKQDIPISKALKKINLQQNNIYYKYYEMSYLINHDEVFKAKEIYDKYTKNKNIKNNELMLEIRDLINLKYVDINSLIKKTVNRISKERDESRKYREVKKLKEACGNQWNNSKKSFYDQLSKKSDYFFLKKLLADEDEWEYCVEFIMKDYNLSNLFDYEFIVNHSKETYLILYIKCLEIYFKENTNYFSFMAYDHLNHLKKLGFNDMVIMEVIYIIKNKFNRRNKLNQLLDSYIEERINYD